MSAAHVRVDTNVSVGCRYMTALLHTRETELTIQIVSAKRQVSLATEWYENFVVGYQSFLADIQGSFFCRWTKSRLESLHLSWNQTPQTRT